MGSDPIAARELIEEVSPMTSAIKSRIAEWAAESCAFVPKRSLINSCFAVGA